MANNLLTPILEGGIRSANFFNGRLLSSEDLNLEKSANRDARKRLGRALGDGVAFGLEVTQSSGVSTIDQPVVTVTPGLAVNRRGQTLTLTTKTDLSLVRSLDSGQAEDNTFDDCIPPTPDVYVAGAGVYLLVVCPASAKEGRAPVGGLGNTISSCNTKYTVECVQFRLIKLDLSDHDLADVAHLRNRLAYKCFGVTETSFTDYVSNPFGTHEPGYGVLDDLRPSVLTDCDVPLALLFWTLAGGIRFIDMWGVRRRISPPPVGDSWLSLASARRLIEGESMFLQFEDQIEEMLLDPNQNAGSIAATDRFQYLPPVGILPLTTDRFPRGFHTDLFFDRIVHHPIVHIEGARVEALVRAALPYPPIELNSGVMIWIYQVRENEQASAKGAQMNAVQPYLIFTTGHRAYMGDPHFDVNRWGFSNWA